MYYIYYGLFWLVSILPLRVLYIISDGLFLLAYYVIGYRKAVIFKNLNIAFPEKTDAEKKRIAKHFYKNLIDYFTETIKLISASDSFILKHMQGNWEVVNAYKHTGKSVQVHLGHNFNWEWANVGAAKNLDFKFLGVYMPIKNKALDRLFRKIRSRSGTILLSAHDMKRDFLPYRHDQYLLGLVADQNPWPASKGLWFDFFNRRTPFTASPAKNAIANDTVVFFAFIHKVKRGYYKVVFELAEEHPTGTNEIELTRKFSRYIEKVVRNYPDMWLWSHRRWKHEWKDEYGDTYYGK